MDRSDHSAIRRFPPSGREAFLEREGCLHLIADWTEVLFLNFRIDQERLQPFVPYPLDLCEGSAWVSLVAFTMRDLRPASLGKLGKMIFYPFREQRFLNVRTYVKHGEERGIHFIAEWISDWVNAQLGPIVYGLPYRFGQLNYHMEDGWIHGQIDSKGNRLAFRGFWDDTGMAQCRETTDSFLLERYAAFNSVNGRNRMFRVWHEPWMRVAAKIELTDETLLTAEFIWWPQAEFADARYSPGVANVLMGAPRRAVSRLE